MRHLAVLTLLAIAPSIPRPTGACSPRSPGDGGPHRPDPAYAGDAVAPSAVMATSMVVFGDDSVGCNSGCGGAVAEIQLHVEATDDQAPADELGYQLTVIDGLPPPGFEAPAQVRLSDYGYFILHFSPSFRGSFTFDLELRAVDLNGNVGPPTVITVTGSA